MLWSLDTYVLWDVLDFCLPPPCGQIVDNWLSTCMHGHQSPLAMASLTSTSMKRIQNTCFENEHLDWQHILPHCLEGKTTNNWSLGVLIPVNNKHEISPPRQLPCFGNMPINWVFPQSANSQQKDHHILAVVLESLMISLSNGTKLYRARAPKGHGHSTVFFTRVSSRQSVRLRSQKSAGTVAGNASTCPNIYPHRLPLSWALRWARCISIYQHGWNTTITRTGKPGSFTQRTMCGYAMLQAL